MSLDDTTTQAQADAPGVQGLRTAAAPAAKRAHSLKDLAIRGSIWTVGGYATSSVLRLGGNLVLTRLLFPEAFGVMALINVFMQGLVMFSDLGIGPSLIRGQRGEDPVYVNTAWTIQVIRGWVLWALSVALAAPAAKFYNEPQLAVLLPVAAFTAVIAGFESTKVFLCRRSLAMERITTLDLLSQVVGLSVMVGWALCWPSVWALVAAGLSGGAVKMILGHLWLPGIRNRFHWETAAAKDLRTFGKWILLSSAVCFVGQQLDRLMLGKYVDMGLLGIYGLAVMMSGLAVDVNMKLVRSVVYPAISRVHREKPERLRENFYRVRRATDFLFMPVLGLLATCGDQVIYVLYDDRYAQAGWIFQVLCVRAAMRVMLEPAESCLMTVGQPRYAFFQHVLRLVWMAVAIPIGWWQGGFAGVVWAVGLSEVLIVPLYWTGLYRHGILNLLLEGRSLAMLIVGVLMGTALRYGLGLS
ncbi:MAG: oligosaccharide flippase family protein [Phycisphaeraceae bacterium]|nr:oligosaccharide flippase family protein [Phycisphaeraceae bacterium]